MNVFDYKLIIIVCFICQLLLVLYYIKTIIF